MRSLARISLGLLGLALIAPGVVEAQYAPTAPPSGYQAVAPSASAPAPVGLDGYPVPAPAVAAPHNHKGRSLCASCAAKQKASNAMLAGKVVGCEHYQGGDGPTVCAKCQAKYQASNVRVPANNMMPGKIVGCEHSRNGVCTACQAALNMPGQFVMAGGQPAVMAGNPGEAPGRAVASSGPNPGVPGYDAGMGEPAPVGVMRASFSEAGPVGTPATYAPQAMPPGRAVAESNAGHDPYQAKSGTFPHPHIIGHLLGLSGRRAEKDEAKARKKAEAHAMTTYDEQGTAQVDEIPASMVFGKKQR